MLSKAQIKYIRSLTKRKFRNEYKVFIAEGEKIAKEWLATDKVIEKIIGAHEWVEQNRKLVLSHPEAELLIVKHTELAGLSSMQSPNDVMLVVPVPQTGDIPLLKEWYLALDDIQDPGNMGTIIRIADWFGIRNIVCSPGCVDIYNPKVVQSAMGSHVRVNIYESNLVPILESIYLPKIATMLNGESVYTMERMDTGVLIIGNESKGISKEVLKIATKKITIPRKGGAESLNAGVSTGILCALLLPC